MYEIIPHILWFGLEVIPVGVLLLNHLCSYNCVGDKSMCETEKYIYGFTTKHLPNKLIPYHSHMRNNQDHIDNNEILVSDWCKNEIKYNWS